MPEPNCVELPQTMVTTIEHDQSRPPTKEDIRALRGWRPIDFAMDWPLLALFVAIAFGVVVFGSTWRSK